MSVGNASSGDIENKMRLDHSRMESVWLPAISYPDIDDDDVPHKGLPGDLGGGYGAVCGGNLVLIEAGRKQDLKWEGVSER